MAPARLQRSRLMPITRLLQTSSFNPEQINELVLAYESVLAALNLLDRSDPLSELVARAVIDCAKAGEIDRAKLHACALAAIMKQ